MKGSRKIILVPTYNEKDNILGLLDKLVSLYPEVEIWVIDDSSPDGTGVVVDKFAANHSKVRLITRAGKNGLGEAYKHALRLVQKLDDVWAVLTMDADGSHDPERVGALFSALENSDVVVGSRYVKGGGISGWDKRRLMLSWGGNLYVRLITGFPIRDATAGFVAYRRSAFEHIDFDKISSSGYSYQIEFKNALFESGASFTEVPITFYERRLGISKVSGNIVAEGLLIPLHIIFQKVRKMKILSYVAVGLMLATAFFSFYKLSESPSVWYDEGLYFQMASHVASGEPAGFQDVPGHIETVSKVSVGFPLVYPIALLFRLFGTDILVARSFMASCIILLTLLVYALVRKSFFPGAALFALALVSMFPPLYGNGKSVLGEVPGIMYLVASLLCLYSARGSGKTGFKLFLAGIFAGLSAVTKPIFILALPAFAVGLFIGWKRRELSGKSIAVWVSSAILPFIVWIATQFQAGDSIRDILAFYSNPQPGNSLVGVIFSNLGHIFSDFGLLYLVVVMVVWVMSFIVRARERRPVNIVEIFAFAFSLLIAAAYLRTAGYNRYLFPAQIVSLIYFPEAVSSIFILIRRKMKLSTLFQATLVPIGVGILFLAGAYQLMFHSWVADYYGSHKTAYWQDYFQANDLKNALFYNVPEVAIFDRDASYSQYLDLAPASGINVGKANVDLMKKGVFETVIMVGTAYDSMKKDLSRSYHPVEMAYKYVILAKNK